MNVATYANGTPGHSWNVTAQVNSSITHKALVTVAEALSLACILTIERPEAVKAAREEYIKSTGGKYICRLVWMPSPNWNMYNPIFLILR